VKQVRRAHQTLKLPESDEIPSLKCVLVQDKIFGVLDLLSSF
jgi:hypothetical protein